MAKPGLELRDCIRVTAGKHFHVTRRQIDCITRKSQFDSFASRAVTKKYSLNTALDREEACAAGHPRVSRFRFAFLR